MEGVAFIEPQGTYGDAVFKIWCHLD